MFIVIWLICGLMFSNLGETVDKNAVKVVKMS